MVRFFNTLLDFFFPRQCLLCRSVLNEFSAESCCESCRHKLPFISTPFCLRCGQPLPKTLFVNHPQNVAVCPACRNRRLPCTKIRSVFIYDEDIAPLILRLKYGDRSDLIPVLADLSFLFQSDIFEGIHLILPVPLAFRRLLQRRYNQAALMAAHLSKRLKVPLEVSILKRVKFKQSQGGLSYHERHQNVKNAFSVFKANKIQGKIILLVDDVMASGATVLECAKLLKQAGAKEVRILTLARSL